MATRNRTTKALTVAQDAPMPRAGDQGWLCADEEADPALFDEPDSPTALAAAQEYCHRCPKADLCLQLGRELGAWGIWGGVALDAGKPKRHQELTHAA